MGGFGDYSFKICAFDEKGAATEFSSPVTVSYKASFTTPENVKVSETNKGQVVWDAVEDAARYNIRIYKNDEKHSLYRTDYTKDSSCWISGVVGEEYLVTVQAMDKDYHVSEWTEEVLVEIVKSEEKPRLDKPQNVRLDESGENIIWDEVDGADYYYVYVDYGSSIHCQKPILEKWEKYVKPWEQGNNGIHRISVYAGSSKSDKASSEASEPLEIEYEPVCEQSITVPQIKVDKGYVKWDEMENAFRYYCRIMVNGYTVNSAELYDSGSAGASASPSVDVSVSPSADVSVSPSVDVSVSPSADVSVSLSADVSVSPSADVSVSPSIGASVSPSMSVPMGPPVSILTRQMDISQCPEGDYDVELWVVDRDGKYNKEVYPLTLDVAHDDSIWIPELFCKDQYGNMAVLWDYDRLRHPDTIDFWIRIRKKDGTLISLKRTYNESYYYLGGLENDEYKIDACVREYNYKKYDGYKLGKWSEVEEVFIHDGSWFNKKNETTTDIETPPEAVDIPEDDRITSITINPAFNMKHKDGNDVEIDLSKIKIKAREIYDEEGLKRAEAALGETLKGNKKYNLLDLTLLYDGKDFSNGYNGLVKVIIPLPKGHRDKTFSCYRLTETDGKVTKELIPGEQTADSYIIYLEHFSEYALVAAGPEEPHTHVYSADWKSDATGHWKECDCKDKAGESAHTQDAGTVTKEATVTETGIKTYKCSVCGYVIRTEEIAKLPLTSEQPSQSPSNSGQPSQPPADKEPHTHVYSTDWKSDAIGHWKECECKDKSEESAHKQDNGTVTKKATGIETGIKTYKCSVCGYVIKTEKIAKLPKDMTNKKTDNVTKVTKAQKKKNEIILNKKISFKLKGNSLSVAWNKLRSADGYDIYAAPCSNSFKGITVSVGNNKASAVIRKINGRKINMRKAYKVKVKAYRLSDGKKYYIGTSAVMHVVGSLNKTNTNAKNIRLKKKAYVIKKGKSAKINASVVKADRKKTLLSKGHGAKLSYVSSDENIAIVTPTGRIKAKKRGKCIIYVRALNGINKKIKVTVS